MTTRRHHLAALAALTLLPAASRARHGDTSNAGDAPAARRALLLGQTGGPHAAVDEAIRQHLTRRGWAVTLAGQDAAPQAAQGMALVIISSTVAAKNVHPGWRQLAVPLLT